MVADYGVAAPRGQEYRHQEPRCLACGWVGPWKAESILLPRHIIIFLILVFAAGAGFIYLLAVLIIRSGEGSRAKICPHCGARNMHTFLYADDPSVPRASGGHGVGPQPAFAMPAQPAYAPPAQWAAPSVPAPTVAVSPAASQTAVGPVARLKVNGRELATISLVPGSRYAVGRGPGNQIVVNDSAVSGTHATLMVHSNRRVGITDAGSTNGTFLNGAALTGEHIIRAGEEFMLGSPDCRLTISG